LLPTLSPPPLLPPLPEVIPCEGDLRRRLYVPRESKWGSRYCILPICNGQTKKYRGWEGELLISKFSMAGAQVGKAMFVLFGGWTSFLWPFWPGSIQNLLLSERLRLILPGCLSECGPCALVSARGRPVVLEPQSLLPRVKGTCSQESKRRAHKVPGYHKI